MAYLGKGPEFQTFTPAIDYFSGNGSTTAFTLSRPVASAAQVMVVVNNVPQHPTTAFSVSGNTITFTGAPSAGTNNIYVYYTTLNQQVIQPGQGTVGLTQLSDALQTAVFGMGFKNRIINGDMRIDQRNAGASVTIPATTTTYTVDRWNAYATQASKFTVQQSTTSPTGFTNSLVCTSSSAYSVTAGDYFVINQRVEGYNISDLAWGTANAQPITIGFWARSSLTGTFGGAIQNSAQDRSYPFSFTINSANTYEYKTVTIAGDTTGTWLTTNGIGMRVFFSLGTGSTFSGTAGTWAGSALFSATGATSVVGTNGATFYITGVQLEKGSTATSFDYRPYGTELALCQRYYQSTGDVAPPVNIRGGYVGMTGAVNSQAFSGCNFVVPMRASPTIVLYDDAGVSGNVLQNSIANGIAATAANMNSRGFNIVNRTSGNFNASSNYPVLAGYTASAEL